MSTLCGACVAAILFFAGLPVDAGRPAPQPDFSQKDYSKLESIRKFWQLVLVRANQQPVGYMHTVVKKGLLGQTPVFLVRREAEDFQGNGLRIYLGTTCRDAASQTWWEPGPRHST